MGCLLLSGLVDFGVGCHTCCSAKKDMEKMGWGEVRTTASVPAELWLVPRMDPGCIIHVEHEHQIHMITLKTQHYRNTRHL